MLCANSTSYYYVLDLSAATITSIEKFKSENSSKYFIIPEEVSLELQL